MHSQYIHNQKYPVIYNVMINFMLDRSMNAVQLDRSEHRLTADAHYCCGVE